MNATKLFTITGISLSAIILATVLVWALANRERPRSAQFALLIDPSDSRTINCGAIETTVQDILTSPNLMPNSSLYFFTTGDDKSADEPILLGKYQLPVNVKVLEGRSKAEQQVQELVGKMQKRCEEEPMKKRSPIILGIKRVIENLRTTGCDEKAACRIFAQTDGQELSETTVKQALAPKSPHNSEPQILIQNNGIQLRICGFAQVNESLKPKDRHNVKATDKAAAVWKSLFSEPQSVVLQPHCH